MCARVSPCSVITLLNGMFIAFHSVHSKSSPESSCPPSGQTICAAFDLRSAQEKLGKKKESACGEWVGGQGWVRGGGMWWWWWWVGAQGGTCVRMCSRVHN